MIEKVLSPAAGTALILGIIGALILASNGVQGSSSAASAYYTLAAEVLVSGIVFSLLFEGMAEIIRLLRRIADTKDTKQNDPKLYVEEKQKI